MTTGLYLHLWEHPTLRLGFSYQSGLFPPRFHLVSNRLPGGNSRDTSPAPGKTEACGP